ncbi:MAG: PE family protein, partial [Mycobacterium sp.]
MQVLVSPEILAAAAADIDRVGVAVNSVNAAAAGLTTHVASAADDEVSTAIAALFSQQA